MIETCTLAFVIAGQTVYSISILAAVAVMLWYLGRKPERQIAKKELQ